MSVKKIGVLSLQGSVAEHIKMLERLENVEPSEVKTLKSLSKVDALIIPGGESTTIAKLLNIFGLMEPLRERIKSGMPVWGTCAGLILLAKNIEGENSHIGLMDMTVQRNAYGRQIDSFSAEAVIEEIGGKEKLPLVFIRAPRIESVGDSVNALCSLDGHIVAARQDNMLATSFHPELTDNLSFHRYFADMIK